MKLAEAGQTLQRLVGCTLVGVIEGMSWVFRFSDGSGLTIEGPWRITGPSAIELGDVDHAQFFGLSEPVDGPGHLRRPIFGTPVAVVTVSPHADIVVTFENGFKLELFANSRATNPGASGLRKVRRSLEWGAASWPALAA